MAQSVVYADLKFATVPSFTAPACPSAPEEADSPYENVPLGLAPTVTSPGRWPRRWRVPVGLLAASLLLLVVATVALGACYWQVTRRLQDGSRQHAAEQSRLSQEVMDREQSLEQTRLELAWARAELQRAWREGNSSQLELGRLNAELGRVMGVLGQTEKDMREVQGRLNSSESTVATLRACLNTDCCPAGWVLYRGKCLFISVQKMSWQDSQDDCKRRSGQLLRPGDWPPWALPHLVKMSGAAYWIGDSYQNQHDKPEEVYEKMHIGRNWLSLCSKTSYGKISNSFCHEHLPWICEKSPEQRPSVLYQTSYEL
ncbi:B-cell differentiation antigen CD72-like [Rhynochetos jubatus]